MKGIRWIRNRIPIPGQATPPTWLPVHLAPAGKIQIVVCPCGTSYGDNTPHRVKTLRCRECELRLRRDDRRNKRRQERAPKLRTECVHCGEPITSKQPHRRFCSARCTNAARRLRVNSEKSS